MSWELKIKRHPRTTGPQADVLRNNFDRKRAAWAEAQKFSEITELLQTEGARDQIYLIEKNSHGKVVQKFCYSPA